MSRDYSLERDLSEFEQMAERLPELVLADRLYLPLAAGYARRSRLPQLSLGVALLRRRRLHCLRSSLGPRQQQRLDSALEQHDAVRREWTVHYEGKLKQEVPARLKQMSAFFRDCQENPSGCAGAYPMEALRRTIVQEILLAMDEFDYDRHDFAVDVERIDIALRRLLQTGDFIWPAVLDTVYPRPTFWWFYGRPVA